uniref:Uncharacterized protein n=1 Tax=viral metagenome TaxID=1070528 RepID=A0A6C0CGB0_9ZZZZ
MEEIYLLSAFSYCIGQMCCWYVIFDACGCIDPNQRRFRNMEQQPQQQLPPPAAKERNPFKNPDLPRDEHLQCAYS